MDFEKYFTDYPYRIVFQKYGERIPISVDTYIAKTFDDAYNYALTLLVYELQFGYEISNAKEKHLITKNSPVVWETYGLELTLFCYIDFISFSKDEHKILRTISGHDLLKENYNIEKCLDKINPRQIVEDDYIIIFTIFKQEEDKIIGVMSFKSTILQGNKIFYYVSSYDCIPKNKTEIDFLVKKRHITTECDETSLIIDRNDCDLLKPNVDCIFYILDPKDAYIEKIEELNFNKYNLIKFSGKK